MKLPLWTGIVSVSTSLLVGGGAVLWTSNAHHGVSAGLWATLAFGGVAAYAASQALVGKLNPPGSRFQELNRQIKEIAPDSTTKLPAIGDAETRAVANAVNALLERFRVDAERLRRDAAVGLSAVDTSLNGVLAIDPDGARPAWWAAA